MSNQLYTGIEFVLRNHIAEITIDNLTISNDIRNAIRWVMRDYPEIFWFAHQYYYNEVDSTIHFQYTFSADRVKTIQQSIDDVVKNDFCIDYVKTLEQQEQIVYVYKWLVTYCNYNANSAYNQGIYSVFVRRNSVCTGYAKAAHYLFKLLGIESRLAFGRLHNDKEEGRHCWNVIKIGDQYYHFDACFGDSILDGVAKMAGIQELFKIDGINYNFLCVSTDEISKTRSIEDKDTLPLCKSSWPNNVIEFLARIQIKQREDIRGCLLTHIGSSADIYLCSKDKNTVLKVFRPNSKITSDKEYLYMQQTQGCSHVLLCNKKYTNIANNIIAIEQSTPIVDLLCSHYYELSLKGLIKMAIDIAVAWAECRDKGVLYRDIHICNIYRANDGIFKFGDFGSCTTYFNAKEIVGNQWFMAPETFVSGIFTKSSAVYSISMVMYFILNNLRPAFWQQGDEDEALRKRMNGDELCLPAVCVNLPQHINEKINSFFRKASAPSPMDRLKSIDELIYELKRLYFYCGNGDYVIHKKGSSFDFDLDAHNEDRIKAQWHYIPRDAYHRFAMGEEAERMCTTAGFEPKENVDIDYLPEEVAIELDYDGTIDVNTNRRIEESVLADEVESFARTMACEPIVQRNSVLGTNRTENVEAYETTAYQPDRITFNPKSLKSKESIWNKLFGRKKYNEVYSSIFAPAEIKRKSHLLVQVYLHLYEETDKVKSFAVESDKNTERRDYIPLSLILKQGDKVDVEFNVYGETCLMNDRKSLVWQGTFTKCSFDYLVPKDIDVDELSCEANLFVNGAMIGEMRFITQIVEVPRNLNPVILSHRFNRIFISYAHQDAQQIKLLALAYKAQGVDYFYDRDSLKPGDVYEEKIFDYIDASDLFVLCWSKNAAQSDYVAKEKGRALLRAYPQLSRKDATLKICPISIEPRTELPGDMKEVYNFEEI